MKLKKLWIPTLIFGIIGGSAKICDTLFNRNGQEFFLGSEVCSTVFICSLLLILLSGVIMAMGDKKGNITAEMPKSIGAAFFGFIASVALVCTGVVSMLSIGSDTSLAEIFLNVVFSLFGGVVLLYESCISYTGHNSMKKMPLLALAVPLWGCYRMLQLFLEYSRVSLHSTEMFDLVSLVFLTLFLYYQSMYFAAFNPGTAVRRSIIYGCCYIMCGLVTTTDLILKMFYPVQSSGSTDSLIIEPTLSRLLICAADAALCFYTIFFLISICKKVRFEEADDADEDDQPLEKYFGNIHTTEDTEEPTASEEVPTPEAATQAADEPAEPETAAEPEEEVIPEPTATIVPPQPEPAAEIITPIISTPEPPAEPAVTVEETPLPEIPQTVKAPEIPQTSYDIPETDNSSQEGEPDLDELYALIDKMSGE